MSDKHKMPPDLRTEIAMLISDTNQPGRWSGTGKAEKDRRFKEADAIIELLKSKSFL